MITTNIYLYFFIFIALYYVSGFIYYLMLWCLSFISAYVVLYAFKYLYDDTQARTYILYTFTYAIIWRFLWRYHFISLQLRRFPVLSPAPMLLYFYMIHISLQPPALALVLSIYKKYIPFICLFSLRESIALAPNTYDIY